MKENSPTDEESSFGRRDYLRLTGAAGVVGLGSSTFVGGASAEDTDPKRTLTIEAPGSRVDYSFSVSGNVTHSRAMGATISGDEISGSDVNGHVSGTGRDSFAFSGELTAFDANSDPILYLNGEPLSDTVTIEDIPEDKTTHYELRVDGEVLKSTAMSAGINPEDEVSPRNTPGSVEPLTDAEPLAGETYALGAVNGGKDSYSISGDITGFHANGNVDLYVNGEVVENPAQFVRTTLTFESPTGEAANYEFSVSEDIAKSRAMGATIDRGDTIDGGTAVGHANDGQRSRDSYVFTGEITDFSGDDNLSVFLSRQEIDPATLSADPQFENTLTIEGNGGLTEYHFAVEGSVTENYGLTAEDTIEGKEVNGALQTGQDSYTFSGDISTFSADTDGKFTTYLNGSEIDPATLGNVRTGPDPGDLPNEVKVTGLDGRTEYGFGVSGSLAPGKVSDTWNGDNTSYEYARGAVGSGTDNYKFSGEIQTLTDFETFQIDIDREAQTIDIEDFDSGGRTDYEITVSGEMTPKTTSSEDSVSGGTATGAIASGSDVYGFTGVISRIRIDQNIKIIGNYNVDDDGSPIEDPVVWTIDQVALEVAEHPYKNLVAFTSPHFGEGLQMYLAREVNSTGDLITNVETVTSAGYGVHALSWEDRSGTTDPDKALLKYSKDEKQFKRETDGDQLGEEVTTHDVPADWPYISSENSKISSQITTLQQKRRFNYCFDTIFAGEWCINARGPEEGRLKCGEGNTPVIEHYQFEVVKSGQANSGVSFWAGIEVDRPCYWVGEENYSKLCWSYCKGDGIPGVSWLSEKIEDAINAALNNLDIIIPAGVVGALAYGLAVGIVVKPPSGVPI